jgi:RNA polymerase sigma-70 factor (ECF subfamily)
MIETDEEVLERVRTGDTEAYRVLVERHSRALYKLAYRMMGNAQDAEDAVQEALLRAFRQLASFTGQASFKTWLFRIAANYCLDIIRARERHAPMPDARSGDTFEPVERGPLPDQLADSQLLRRRLDAAMRDLTAQERTAFVLRHCQGESIDDIAAALGVNNSAAKHSVFRAVKKLRQSLEPLMGVVI